MVTAKKKPAKKTTKPKKAAPVEIIVIADRSGSMEELKVEAINGFNHFLSEQQKLPGEANLTLRLFDTEHTMPINKQPVKDVKPLDSTTFVPRGATALNDAIGQALTALEAAKPDKAIVVILTDGQENASHEFTREQVKEKITAAEKRGWQVVYLAANQDAFAVGASYGVNAGSTANFAYSVQGVTRAFDIATVSTSGYRSGDVVDLTQHGSNGTP